MLKVKNSSRFERLISGISDYFKNNLGVELKSDLSVENLFGLKSVLSNVNNMLTYKTTLSFVEWLGKAKYISNQTEVETVKRIDETSPNTNGFDVQIEEPKIVAEVKCNIPINKSESFGVAQRNGIIHDMKDKLLAKSDYLKFMVMLDNPKTKAAFCNDEGFEKLLDSKGLKKDVNYKIVDSSVKCDDKKFIYVVFVKVK